MFCTNDLSEDHTSQKCNLKFPLQYVIFIKDSLCVCVCLEFTMHYIYNIRVITLEL